MKQALRGILRIATAGALLMGLASGASAVPLLLTPGDMVLPVPALGSASNCEPGCVNSTFPAASSPLTLLYKQNVGEGSDSGSYASSYSTIFANSDADATISYGSGSSIVCPECYLAIKDGNNYPIYYFYNLSAWDGTSQIQMSGFWPGSGSISHVSIWGVPGEPCVGERCNPVPVPATLALLGLGVLGLGLARRRNKQ